MRSASRPNELSVILSGKRIAVAGLSALAWAALLAAATPAGAAPRIVCREPVYQFGERLNTGAVEHVFLIENRGDAPLVIGAVRSCCGTASSIASNLIAPGSNAALSVSVPLAGKRGAVQKSIYVASNDPTEPYCQLGVTGTATSDAYVEPSGVDFPDVQPAGNDERCVRLVTSPHLALCVTGLVVNTARFAATYSKTNDGYSVVVRAVPPFEPGLTQGSMQILTDNKIYAQFDVRLTATLASDIVVVPPCITLVVAAGQQTPVARCVVVKSRRGTPFKILGMDLPDPGAAATAISLPSGGYRVEIKDLRPAPGLDGKRFVIRTDHADGAAITIPIQVVAGVTDTKRAQ